MATKERGKTCMLRMLKSGAEEREHSVLVSRPPFLGSSTEERS